MKLSNHLPSLELQESSFSSGTTSQWRGTLLCLTKGARHFEHGFVEDAENEAVSLTGWLFVCRNLFLVHFVSLDRVRIVSLM